MIFELTLIQIGIDPYKSQFPAIGIMILFLQRTCKILDLSVAVVGCSRYLS
jgi:hypothetical protein